MTTKRHWIQSEFPIESQNKIVLSHLRMYRTITALIAAKNYGILRLSARIHDLKNKGYLIPGESIAAPLEFQGSKHWSVYTLKID